MISTMDKLKRAVLIYNPAARSTAAPEMWLGGVVHRLCNEGGFHVVVVPTQPESSADEFCRTLDQPCDLIVAAGGDGTIRAVLQAVATIGSSVPVGILPVGTGNQLARNLRIYDDNLLIDPLERAVDVLLSGRAKKIDLGKMNGHHFAVAAGAGPISDAIIAPAREDKSTWGMLAYVSTVLQTFAVPPVVFKVTTGGSSFVVAAWGIFVSNVADLGVGQLSATAELNDGLLDLCILNPASFADYLELGFRFGTGFVGGEAQYYIRKVKEVQIEVLPVKSPMSQFQRFGHKVRSMLSGQADAPAPVHREVTAMIDGDACGTTPMHIEVIPHAITILAPPAQTG